MIFSAIGLASSSVISSMYLKIDVKEKEIKNVFEKGMLDLKKSMLNDYPDKDSKYIIENLFK